MGFLLRDLEEKYDLELDRILKEIKNLKKENVKVLLQFPDGLKPYGLEICDFIEKNSGADVSIYLGDCFGACDTPLVNEKDFDLLIQFGHSAWKFD